VLFLGIASLVVRSEPSLCPRAVLRRLVKGYLGPAQPIAVACSASSEAIDALLCTKGGSPRVVPDETKLAITNCASRGSARSKTFGAVGHGGLLFVLSSLVDHPFLSLALDQTVRSFDRHILGRSRSAVQLNVSKRRASKGGYGTIQRFMVPALRPTRSAIGQTRWRSIG
jgi:hypothetical protein